MLSNTNISNWVSSSLGRNMVFSFPVEVYRRRTECELLQETTKYVDSYTAFHISQKLSGKLFHIFKFCTALRLKYEPWLFICLVIGDIFNNAGVLGD